MKLSNCLLRPRRMLDTQTIPAPFDSQAHDYDSEFTYTALGRALRERVWSHFEEIFFFGDHVLELNCGTGEDAFWLARRGVQVVATDQSAEMLAVTKSKTRNLPVEIAWLDLATPEAEFYPAQFTGAFSNFGGLNCVADLNPIAAQLGSWLRPGAKLLLVIMGPLCAWEIASNLLRGRARRAFRRRRSEGLVANIGEAQVQIFYPSPAHVADVFADNFRVTRLTGLGVTLPPSLNATKLNSQPKLLHTLEWLEDALAARWPFRLLGDHYILELERLP